MNIRNIPPAGFNFKAQKEPKDYAYTLLTHPEIAKNQKEKNFLKAFNAMYPNWKEDKYWEHRLKQDTVFSRVEGKFITGLPDFYVPEWIGAVGGIAVSIFSVAMLIRQHRGLESLNKKQKFIYAVLTPGGLIGAIDTIKYIATGRRLFEKENNNSQNKTVEK